ncbi:NAD(P)-binding protein [Aspergillus undulatus]|uniref:NAD(P)-binding protein n=1 Tax=Aspergillus undulatus TaxID=1810928 RepID=UPI003CCD7709
MADFDSATIEKRATRLAFLKRQLFGKPPLVTRNEIDLSGKTAIVTGSNTGLGFECSKQLLSLDLSRLIIAVRSETKGEEAKKRLLLANAKKQQQQQTRDHEYTKTVNRLDIVINNAGVLKREFNPDPRTGHETIQVNHLGNSLLIILLIPVLRSKTPNSSNSPGRITFVNSDIPSWAKFAQRNTVPLLLAFDDRSTFDVFDRYPTSKLLGQLFLRELVKRVPPSGVNGSFLGSIARSMSMFLARSASVGARALTDAVVNHSGGSHGMYIEDGEVVPMAPFVYTPEGEKVAAQLWGETLDELAFAGVQDILNGLGK